MSEELNWIKKNVMLSLPKHLYRNSNYLPLR